MELIRNKSALVLIDDGEINQGDYFLLKKKDPIWRWLGSGIRYRGLAHRVRGCYQISSKLELPHLPKLPSPEPGKTPISFEPKYNLCAGICGICDGSCNGFKINVSGEIIGTYKYK